MTIAGAVLWSLSQVTTPHAQTADPRLLSLACAGCHRPDGRSPPPIPALSGQTAAAIGAKLRGFRDNRIPSTVMGRIARGYSDADIDAVAEQIAASGKPP